MSAAGDAPLAAARALVAEGRIDAAERHLAATIAETFGLDVAEVAVNRDVYSLNSLNGTVELHGGRSFFFKFHQEEGEAGAVEEYYRAELLEQAGFPVDRPAYVSHEVGRQILLYRRRRDRRLADVCRDIELSGTSPGDAVVAAQERLDDLLIDRYRATLHADAGAESTREPIHQLFHARLVDPQRPDAAGGRLARFYHGRRLELPGLSLDWDDFAALRWRINGVTYAHTVGELFAEARTRLRPEALAGHGQVTAHGDAHNANVWYEERRDAPPRLAFFDPAFAGAHVPALLAEVKATFHNVFAHPFILYDPAEATRRYTVRAAVRDGVLEVGHDWTPGPLREAFLRSKTGRVWRPLLDELSRRGLRPPDAERIVRCALFCCPTLVTNLAAGAPDSPHTPGSTRLCVAAAVQCGSVPLDRPDPWLGGVF